MIGRLILGLLALVLAVFFFGPRPEYGPADASAYYRHNLSQTGASTKQFVEGLAEHERQLLAEGALRQNTEARVILADSARKTPVAILYIHGFSASAEEGSPVAEQVARRYGANLYYMRLSDHGLTGKESFAEANPSQWQAEAQRAYQDALDYLGDRVLVVGTSTGATLALDIASDSMFQESLAGLVLYSPNIALANPAAALLNGPWGLQLGRLLTGSEYRTLMDIPKACDYIWTLNYRVEGIVALQELLERTMTEETFASVKVPTLAAYYYRDKDHQDQIISIDAVEDMFGELGTVPTKKRLQPIDNVSGHVFTTDCRTQPAGLDSVRAVTQRFLEEVVGLEPNPSGLVVVE